MKFGTNIPSMFTTSMKKPRKLGQLYIIIKQIRLFQKYFFENIEKIYKQLKATKKSKKDKILLPNDKEIIISKKD